MPDFLRGSWSKARTVVKYLKANITMFNKNKIISIVNKNENEIKSPILSMIARQMDKWTKGEEYILRHNINPQLIPTALPHVALVERLNECNKRFYIRLAGEEITNRTLGFTAKNFIEDVTPEFYSTSMIEQYGLAIDDGAVQIQDIIWNYDFRVLHIERFLVPVIFKDVSKPDGLLIATVRAEDTLEYMVDNPKFDSDK